MKYNVHFMGYYGYDIKVEADSKDEAMDKADALFCNLSNEEFCNGATFVDNGVEVEEVE